MMLALTSNIAGAFLIPFLFFLVTCGLPLFFMEVSLGQFRGKGILHVWEICPLFKGRYENIFSVFFDQGPELQCLLRVKEDLS